MGVRVCVVNLGCKVNRVESDWMETAFSEAGCTLVPERDADLVAVNTCAVTGEAQAKTRKAVRRAANLPQAPFVAVTGCVANLFPAELEALSPSVYVFANKHTLAVDALAAYAEKRGANPDFGCAGGEGLGPRAHQDLARIAGDACAEGEGSALHPAGQRVLRSRRGIKVQDGCDNRCTYCIVWRARGASRSMPLPKIEAQVRQVLAQGADEVVLSGINLGRFRALDGSGTEIDLSLLLDRVCALGARMVRLSSIEPPDLTAAVVDSMARNAPAVCHHLHLPLQSGCDTVLARMGRSYTTAEFTQVVGRIRAVLPHASLSTDVIVGFPGETDEEFEATLAFCRAMRFSKMHVFRYSVRPGTEAAEMPCQIDPRVSQARSERLRALADEMRLEDARARVGRVERVLVEHVDRLGVAHGSTASYHDVRLPAGCHALTGPGLVDVELTGLVPGEGAVLIGTVAG